MGLYTYDSTPIPKSDRIPKLVENLYAKMPEIESARAVLITESYTEPEASSFLGWRQALEQGRGAEPRALQPRSHGRRCRGSLAGYR